MKEKYWISRKGYEKLNEKYNQILKEEIDIQKQIGDSVKMDNDLRENPDYMALQSKAMSEIKFRIQKIRDVLFNCEIIDDSPMYKNNQGEEVIVSSIVTLKFEDDEIETYQILGYDEADLDNNIISYLSSLGQVLLGKKKGEVFTFVNNDYSEKIEIIDIQKGDL